MRKKIGKWLSVLLPVLLGVFLIVYTYEKFTPEQILEIKGYFKNADYSYIYIGLAIAFLGNASRAYRWKYVLEHMGYTTSFYNNFMAVNISYLLNLTVPKSGEISRAFPLTRVLDLSLQRELLICLCYCCLWYWLCFYNLML